MLFAVDLYFKPESRNLEAQTQTRNKDSHARNVHCYGATLFVVGATPFVVSGTLGLLLRAKQQGVIDELAPLMDDLEAVGANLSKSVIAHALKLAGEDGQ